MAATDSLKEEFPCARVELLELDVGLPNAVDVIDACLAKHGLYLDVLVNNAGVGVGGRFTALDPTRLEELIVTNVMAVSRLMRHFLPAMLARGRGGIMNLASLAAFAPGPWQHLILRARPTCCP